MYYKKYRKYKNKYLELREKYLSSMHHELSPNISNHETWLSNIINDKKLIKERYDDLECLLNTFVCKSSNYIVFLNEWLDYTNLIITKLKCKEKCEEVFLNQYKNMHLKVTNLWQNIIYNCLDKQNISINITTRELVISNFVNGHISSIEKIGYKLNNNSKDVLKEAFTKWFLCNQCPAPFSVISILHEEKKRGCNLIKDSDKKDATNLISVSEHCLAMATYWYNESPKSITSSELDELIIMSLFHDIYYYEDFINHDMHILDLFKSYIYSDNIKKIIGMHFDLVPVNNPKYIFKSDIEELTNKWIELDWYYTLKKPMFPTSKKDEYLPIETFYDIIGRVMTK
jgi:hypothetical protein